MNSGRINKLEQVMLNEGIDYMVLIPGSNMQYFLGFSPMLTKRTALAVFSAAGQAPVLVLPSLEAPNARLQTQGALKIFEWEDGKGPKDAIKKALQFLNDKVVLGIEYTSMRVQELKLVEEVLSEFNCRLLTRDISSVVGRIRMVKTPDEIKKMQKAAEIVGRALQKTVSQIEKQMTEKELSAICTSEIIKAGAAGESFEAFAGFGENTANPHHEPGNRELKKGDLIMIDCGAVFEGYASDITRTFAFGEPGEKARGIYEVVRKANEAARKAVKPGVTGQQIDRAARSVIEKAGYGPHFLHRTGHGLGTEVFPVHEYPDIMEGADIPLPEGTTFTIEPGVYLEGVGGVRIEDDVVILKTGCHSLTSFSRELLILK